MNFGGMHMSGNKAVVTKGIGALRHNPSWDSELVDEALFGMPVEIVDKNNDWLFIETFYGYKGYIYEKDVSREIHDGWEMGEKQYVAAPFADVLNNSKYASAVMATVPRGASLVLTGQSQDGWQQVMLPGGEKGWVREEALFKKSSKSGRELRQSIVQTAMLYLGTQYRWGGKTPAGIDCSGLSFMSCLLNGILLPRDAEDQMGFMKKIDRTDSKPGDLLFFPGHVAVYIGEDKFIHATGTDAVVKVNSLNEDSKMYREDLDKKYLCSGTVF
jgi:cell wall-associated NlpC family hydrolase